MKLTDAQIATRVASVTVFDGWRRKVHRLRRLTAGDITALDVGVGSSAHETEMSELARGGVSANELYDILVTEIEEGRSNKLLQTVRTLIFQTSLVFPDIELEDVDSQIAAVNSLYIKNRARRCNMQKHRRLALTDYLITGVGATFCGFRDDYPFIEFADILDVCWDLTAPTLQEARWASRIVRRPLGEWLDDMTAKQSAKLLKAVGVDRADAKGDDTPISVALYYDIHGEDGTEAWFYTADNGSDADEDTLVHRGTNPYASYCGGVRQTALPIRFQTHLAMPSVRNPIGAVEQMLPAQIAIWTADRLIRDSMSVGAPAREMEEGAYTPESLDAWKEDQTSILIRKKGSNPMVQSSPLDVPPRAMEYRAMNESDLVAQGGANPYASGAPVKGVKYASEVNAIQGNAGLVAAAVGKDESLAWADNVAMLLAIGKDYDQAPITLRLRDGDDILTLEFDESDPIADYLRPDAEITVREDSLIFKSREERMAQAAADVQLAMGLAQMYPGFLEKSVEDYLRASGKKNIGDYLAKPEPVMPDPSMMGGAMPPGMEDGGQAMDAMASTFQ
jgi:hypothetical protein